MSFLDDFDPFTWSDEPDSDERITLAFDFVKHSTGKADLLVFDEKEVWLPKSQIEIFISNNGNTVELPYWLAEKNGIEDYETKE